MKKNLLAIIAAVVALTACIGILAGCSNNSAGGDTNTTTEPTQESTTETTAPQVQEDVMGKIESVSDSFVKLVIYTATGEVTDYVALDVATLTATQDSDYVYTASTTKYYKVVNGVQSDATRADLTVDAMVASTTDAEGVQHIYIYTNGQDDTSAPSQDPTDSSAGAIA